MNVGLALEIDASIDESAAVVTELEDALLEFFRERDYGSDVANLTIGVILTTPDVEGLHPVRKLRYRKHVTFRSPKMEFFNVVEYDVKPDFRVFTQLSPSQARQYLARLIVESAGVLDRHRRKYPNFDVAKFREDLKVCLQG